MDNAITSQRHIDQDIVEVKRAAEDYTVSYVTVELDGVEYAVVVDGHHSYEAARQDKAEVDWELSVESQKEADAMSAVDFLDSRWMGDDWFFIATGKLVF